MIHIQVNLNKSRIIMYVLERVTSALQKEPVAIDNSVNKGRSIEYE